MFPALKNHNEVNFFEVVCDIGDISFACQKLKWGYFEIKENLFLQVRPIDIELSKTTLIFASQVVASFIIWVVLLLSMSYHMFNSWDFLTATHGLM